MQEKFIIIYKVHNSAAYELALHIQTWLNTRQIDTEIAEVSQVKKLSGNICIVLGGDGTLLGVGRKLVGKSIPILSINFGKVGFLTSGEVPNWEKLLNEVLEKKLLIRKCAILKWGLLREGKIIEQGYAVNDVVIARGSQARLINLSISIDTHYLTSLRCDGVIICTPLGSSGYNSSAGGPFIYPTLPSFCLTPICPFLSGIKPLILPASSQAVFKILANTVHTYLTIDGQEAWKLQTDDEILITGMEDGLQFINDPNHFFINLAKMIHC